MGQIAGKSWLLSLFFPPFFSTHLSSLWKFSPFWQPCEEWINVSEPGRVKETKGCKLRQYTAQPWLSAWVTLLQGRREQILISLRNTELLIVSLWRGALLGFILQVIVLALWEVQQFGSKKYAAAAVDFLALKEVLKHCMKADWEMTQIGFAFKPKVLYDSLNFNRMEEFTLGSSESLGWGHT